ncbi:hypothetical protein ABPG74_014971 [Tetrahymena malaccensis]
MVWPVIEFTIYIILSIIVFILMCTKLCNQRKKLDTKLYEKKLDILHKKFLQYHSKQKQDQQIDQSNQRDEENPQQASKKKGKELECITHGIGNFQIIDQQLQNVNILKIMRLVKVNGESFKNSKMNDIKLYQKVRWFQLIEYQNIIINKLFSQVKMYERSKLRLVWFLAQQQINRKSVFYLILQDEKIGQLHRIASIFIFNIEVIAILVLCQSIRRTFIFSWYNLDSQNFDASLSVKIVMICFLIQFFILTPLFLLFQHQIENIYSEYQHIKQKITEIHQTKQSCFRLSSGTTNIIISVIILVIAIYQSICMSSEINYNIDYLIALTWLTLCILEVFLFRNFYIIAFNYFLQFVYTVSQLQQNIRIILLVYFIIEKTQRKGKSRETDDIRRSIMQKITTQQKIQMQKQITKAKTQKAKSDKQLQKSVKQKTQKPIDEQEEQAQAQKSQEGVDENKENEQLQEDLLEEGDDIFNFSSSFFEEDFENAVNDTQKQESQSNNLKESENQNNILPQSILNRNTNSINSYKVEQNNDNILEANQQETTNENHQALDKINQEIVECTTEQNNNTEKKLNTSLAFHDESVIQEEQHVILDTNTELKQPKNKKNYTFSRILNSSCEIYTVKHITQIAPNNVNTSDIKSFQTADGFNQNDNNRNNSNISTFNEFKQSINENIQNKQQIVNVDNSLTINREIGIGRINNLQICNIMKLQDQKKYENDVSFLKNLAELKTIKQNNLVSLNKTNNEISIFGQKETSFLVNDEIIQNNQQKNNCSESNILNKSELLEILKPCGLTFQQNA